MTQPAIKRATLDDLLALPEDCRCELVDGQLVDKEAARFEHSHAQASIASWTGSLFKRKPEGSTGG